MRYRWLAPVMVKLDAPTPSSRIGALPQGSCLLLIGHGRLGIDHLEVVLRHGAPKWAADDSQSPVWSHETLIFHSFRHQNVG